VDSRIRYAVPDESLCTDMLSERLRGTEGYSSRTTLGPEIPCTLNQHIDYKPLDMTDTVKHRLRRQLRCDSNVSPSPVNYALWG